jgi:hypothetical protein
VHGIGVSTPKAAAVAAAVAGFAKLVHTPKGETFKKGTESIIVPIGGPPQKAQEVGRKFKGVGTIPIEHLHKAP